MAPPVALTLAARHALLVGLLLLCTQQCGTHG